MTDASPFPMPKMECRECGREPHEGYCYPILDRILVVELLLLGAVIFALVMGVRFDV